MGLSWPTLLIFSFYPSTAWNVVQLHHKLSHSSAVFPYTHTTQISGYIDKLDNIELLLSYFCIPTHLLLLALWETSESMHTFTSHCSIPGIEGAHKVRKSLPLNPAVTLGQVTAPCLGLQLLPPHRA